MAFRNFSLKDSCFIHRKDQIDLMNLSIKFFFKYSDFLILVEALKAYIILDSMYKYKFYEFAQQSKFNKEKIFFRAQFRLKLPHLYSSNKLLNMICENFANMVNLVFTFYVFSYFDTFNIST